MSQNKSRLLVDPRLVILAVGAAIGAPGTVLFKRMAVLDRLVWVVVGVVAWWYLYRCVKEVWARGRRTGESDDPGGSGTA
jgi:hypothetical protein